MLHKLDEKYHVIRYDSRLLKLVEKNYFISEIECLDLVYVTTNNSQYLIDVLFTNVSDHIALKWLNDKTDLTGRLMRRALHLSRFQYTVRHRIICEILTV